LSLGNWADSHERADLGWHFPSGLFDSDIILIQKKKKAGTKTDFLSWLHPFASEVWLVMLLTVFFFDDHMDFTKAFGMSRAG
jgi:hypothetical protein